MAGTLAAWIAVSFPWVVVFAMGLVVGFAASLHVKQSEDRAELRELRLHLEQQVGQTEMWRQNYEGITVLFSGAVATPPWQPLRTDLAYEHLRS